MSESITKSVILDLLRSSFPNFHIDPEYINLPYLIAGDFAGYLLECYNNSNTIELKKGFDFIEQLYKSNSDEIRELATIGYLEGIQNRWSNNGVNPELIHNEMGTLSKKWWNQLHKFWNKKIKYVGETIDSE
jgi:hypothetical protein